MDERAQFTRRDVNRTLLRAALLLAAGPALAAPAPAPLFDFAIAGGYHHGLSKALADLAPGMRLQLRAEPDNPFDPDAVAVLTADGLMLGYLPRSANAPVAALLARGRAVTAEITGWLNVFRDADIPDDLAFTSFRSGDPRIRLFA